VKAAWHEPPHVPAQELANEPAHAPTEEPVHEQVHEPRRLGPRAWLLQGGRLVCSDLRRHRSIFALVAAIWVLAVVRVFVHHVPLLPILFNWTPSLPYRVAVVDYLASTVSRGDLVVYAFDGPAASSDYRGLRGQAFFKRVAGVAGDLVTVHERDVFVNGQHVGRAKTHTFDRRALSPIEPGVIPPGKVYVMGTGIDSFDSRYREAGLVDVSCVAAVVRPVL
jgi:conjugal transfer pilin signal peptidase TrbI